MPFEDTEKNEITEESIDTETKPIKPLMTGDRSLPQQRRMNN